MSHHDTALEKMFLQGRTYHQWLPKDLPDDVLRQIYDLAKMGPTSTNGCPMRIYFVRSSAEREKLLSCLMGPNIEQTKAAPVTAIIGYDLDFYQKLPHLSPHNNAYSWFSGNEAYIQETAYRNGTLQGGYFILAARACGVDCGPMSGFDTQKVDELFFKGTSIKSNFLCNLGYGDPQGLHPRGPRLPFEEACKVI